MAEPNFELVRELTEEAEERLENGTLTRAKLKELTDKARRALGDSHDGLETLIQLSGVLDQIDAMQKESA